MKINRLGLSFFISILFLCNQWIGFAQQQPESCLYCIVAKQEFSSWGSCSSDPDYQQADIKLNLTGGVSILESIKSDRLNQNVYFLPKFYSPSQDKTISSLSNGTNLLSQIHVHTWASDIINDTELDYPFESGDLKVGVNTQSHEASDPCHNFISFDREGYTMKTTIIIDDPIHLTINNNLNNSKFCLDYESISLHVGSFYANNNATKPMLQVALDDGKDDGQSTWENINNVTISPNSDIVLSYQTIAGHKDVPSSHFFTWMSKNLKFRVVKTLLNSFQSAGLKVSSVNFYPLGIQYSVLQTNRTSCNNNVILTIQLENGADAGYLNFDPSRFYWSATESVNGTPTGYYHCQMQPVTGSNTLFKIILTSDLGVIQTPDPFSEDNSIPISWKIQLIDNNNLDKQACVRTFIIPVKPDSIKVKQKAPPLYTINGIQYDVPDMNHPYAMVNVDDPYDLSYLRLPYVISEGSTELLTIDKTPLTYDEMSQHQKDSLNALFETEYAALLTKSQNPYRSYFNQKLNEWWNANPNGTLLPLPDYTRPYLFSKDSTFFLCMSLTGYIYKVDAKTFAMEQKTNISTQGVDFGGISPDNNTLIYTLGSCCSGATIWKMPINGSGINNGTQVVLPFNHNINGISSEAFRPNIFFDNQNIILGREPWSGGNGLFKKNIVTGALTTMVAATDAFDPCLSPDGTFVLFRNATSFYKGAVTGNSVTGIAAVFTGSTVIMSQDGTYALIGKNGKTYKYMLTGTPAPEVEVLAREIDDYNFVLTKSGKCIYFYNGTSPDFTERGFYLSSLNGGIGTKINSVYGEYLSLSSNSKYLLYNNITTGKTYKLYVGIDEAASSLYPNNDVAASWFDTYKAIYKDKWLNQRIGVRISNGIRVNETQHLQLTDHDNCVYPFDIYVKAPPQPSFSQSIVKYPDDACAKNGAVKITFLGGGSTPFVHTAGTLKNVNDAITVTGLSYGENTIYFTDAVGNESCTYVVTIGSATVGIETISTTAQTCSPANGTITIPVGSMSGNITYSVTCTYPNKTYTYTTTANSYTFTNLPSGDYSANVTSGSCNFTQSNINIADKIFDITTPITTVDATTIAGTGSVTLAFKNRTNTVSWYSVTPATVFNPTESTNSITYPGINPNSYTIVARHIANGLNCDVTKSFTITKPQFTAMVNLEEIDDHLVTTVNLSSVQNFPANYHLRLLNASNDVITDGDNLKNMSSTISVAGSYKFNLVYGSYNIDLYSFSYPLGTIGNSQVITSPDCPGGTGSITLSPTGGIGGTNLQISTDGLTFNNVNTYAVKGGSFTYYIKDTKTTNADVQGNPVIVQASIEKTFETTIPEPSPVHAQTIIPVNPTCSGFNNGEVSIAALSGGSGTYSFSVNQANWYDSQAKISNLDSGVYILYLKDNQNNCPVVNSGSFHLIKPAVMKIETLTVNQPVCGLENGYIQAEVAGGNGSYRYDLTLNGQPYASRPILSTDTILDMGSLLPSGLYNLTITDNFNCTISQPVTLNTYVNPNITDINTIDVRCYGETNGDVQILTQSGTHTIAKSYLRSLDFTFKDSIDDLSKHFINLETGRYELIAKDVNGCISDLPYPVVIHQPDAALSMALNSISPVILKGSATGRIQATVYGGNEGLKKIRLLNSNASCVDSSFQRNKSPFFINSLHADTYTISIEDTKGCLLQSSSLSVIEPDSALGFTVTNKQDARCKSQTGSITVKAYGGWGGYNYKRSTTNTYLNQNTFNNLYAGNYMITVQDRLGATVMDTVALYEPKDSLRSWISDSNSPTCANNGSLQIGIKGGTAPYVFLNENTNETQPVSLPQTITIPNLYSGSYSMQITDNNGCHYELENVLTDTQLLVIKSMDPIYPSGVGTNDGGIHAVITGGESPFIYQWKQRFGTVLPGNTASLGNIPAGHYEVTVTEKSGCSATSFLYLPGINDKLFTIEKIGNETSYVAKNGYCTLTADVISWKTFELITPANARIIYNSTDSTTLFYYKNNKIHLQNLEGGDYFISGITSEDNTVYALFNIAQYLPLKVKNKTITPVSKTGGTNGQIMYSVAGGGGENTFNWVRIIDPGNNVAQPSLSYTESSILSNIPAGKYSVTTTDQYQNFIVDTLIVTEPASPLKISINDFKNESCKSTEDAYATVQATGGWGDYQFRDDSQSNYLNVNMFYNLNVRQHYFYIIDKMGVTDSIALNITEPVRLTSGISFIDSVNCKNNLDGNIGFKINGGTAPYRYANLTNPVFWKQDTIDRNIAEGAHTYIFTDSHNCIGKDTLTVFMPEPDSLLFTNINVTHTTCNTDNGSIHVSLQGGTKPYQYAWYDYGNNLIGTGNEINNLSQNGYYTLNVFDKHNCYQHVEQMIKPSVNPVITDISTTPVICYGGNTGTAAIVSVKQGTPVAPYGFTWSNGDTGQIAHALPLGTHSVLVTDTNQCSSVKFFNVTQPDSLWIGISDRKNALCYGYNDAYLNAQGHGGVGGYTYSWSTGDTTRRIQSLYQGDYSLTLTDKNNCTNTSLFTVSQPDQLKVDLGPDIKICPGNTYILDGKKFYSHTWSTKNGLFSTERYVTLTEGNDYHLEVTDSIGCIARDTFNLSIGNDALLADFLLSSQAVLGDTLSIFELSNMALDSLQWNYQDTVFSKIENNTGFSYILYLKTLQKGIYNVNLSAFSGGCISKATKQVEIIGGTNGTNPDDNLGYKDPLILSFIVLPNPTNGDFKVNIKLSKTADINLVLYTIVSATKLDDRNEKGLDDYSVDYNFNGLNSGTYLLILKAGNERKQLKIIIQK